MIKKTKAQLDKARYDKWMQFYSPLLNYVEKDIKDYTDAKYNQNSQSGNILSFEIEQQKITDFIAGFVNNTITNESMKQRYLLNLYGKNPNVVLKIKVDPKPKNASEQEMKEWDQSDTGRVKPHDVDGKIIKNSDLGKVFVRVRLGEELGNGKIKTDIFKVITYMHEIAHSIAESNMYEQYIPVENDYSVEIESMFMEDLFLSYLTKNADDITKALYVEGASKTLDSQFLMDVVDAYRKERDIGFVKTLDYIKNEPFDPTNPGLKPYKFRYFVGEMYCHILDDMYKKNPAETIDNFAVFLENNASLDLEESSKIIFGDENITIDDIVDNFKSSLIEKTQKLINEQNKGQQQV